MTKDDLNKRTILFAIGIIKTVEEECDETLFWLELTEEAAIMDKEKILKLKSEANELTAIFTASGKTARQKNPKSTIRNPK
jgi:four helix bundle protein